MELDRTSGARQVVSNQLDQHEGVLRGVILAPDTETRRRLKQEPRVKGRVTENHDGTEAEAPAPLQARANQRRTYALALMLGSDCHRREAHDLPLRMADERYGREHDVTDDLPVLFRDERNHRPRLIPQSIDEIGLRRCLEGRHVDRADSVSVARLFETNDHGEWLGGSEYSMTLLARLTTSSTTTVSAGIKLRLAHRQP